MNPLDKRPLGSLQELLGVARHDPAIFHPTRDTGSFSRHSCINSRSAPLISQVDRGAWTTQAIGMDTGPTYGVALMTGGVARDC